jgi:hypothetical protein
MKKLSTGHNSTLGNYLKLTEVVFGKESKAAAYLNEKIAESPNGEDEEVIADEGQMIYLLSQIDQGLTND